MTLKEKIHEQCASLLAVRLEASQQKLRDLSESVANETKSSAGDKYETSRAMLHIEQNQVRMQTAGLLAQNAVLNSIDPQNISLHISLGSLVRMGNIHYYLSIGLGKMQTDGYQVIALSLQSPLGSRLKGLVCGDKVEMNGRIFLVDEVL